MSRVEVQDAPVPERAGMSLDRRVRPSGDVLDHLDELVGGISLPAGELDQLMNFLRDSAALGRPGNRNAAAASKLE
jgi:hypothetical protein